MGAGGSVLASSQVKESFRKLLEEVKAEAERLKLDGSCSTALDALALCWSLTNLLGDDERLAATQEAQEAFLSITQIVASVVALSSPSKAAHQPNVSRVCAGFGWALHGLCFELEDGSRLGRFLNNDRTDVGLMQDSDLKDRGGKWTKLMDGEYITKVSGHHCKEGYLCYDIHLHTSKSRSIDFSPSHHQWRGDSFDFAAPPGSQIINVDLNDGNCRGIKTAPVTSSAEDRQELQDALASDRLDNLWASLMAVGAQDSTGAKTKTVKKLATSLNKQHLPCFQKKAEQKPATVQKKETQQQPPAAPEPASAPAPAPASAPSAARSPSKPSETSKKEFARLLKEAAAAADKLRKTDTSTDANARHALKVCKSLTDCLGEDQGLAASEEAQEAVIPVTQILTSIAELCHPSAAKITSAVARICSGKGWALHGLCFELQDGRRLGRFLQNDGADMDLPNDSGLVSRGGKWTKLGDGEYITKVSGHHCKEHYLCYDIELHTSESRRIRFSPDHYSWCGDAFEFEAKPHTQIVNVNFDDGFCKGIDTMPVEEVWSEEDRERLKEAFASKAFDSMWESLMAVATRDDIGAKAKYVYHVACNMKKQHLPCFAKLASNMRETHRPPAFWDESLLESVKIEEGHRITTDDGRVLFSERTLSDQELQLIQTLVNKSFVRRYTRDRRGESVPTGLTLVSGLHIQNLNCWSDFVKRNDEIKAGARGEGGAWRLERLLTREVLEEDEKFSLDTESNTEWLWHGTNSAAAKMIARGDFRMDKAGSNAGTLFGKGLYFAESCSKSDEYSKEDDKGLRCLLLCRVTLGKVKYCDERDPNPDELVRSCLDGSHHSVLGDREKVHNTFREFIVYDDDQAYAEYVLFYKRVYK